MVKKNKNSIVSILDFGASKVSCFIARISPHNQIQVLGIGHNIAHGIKGGRITDLKAAETSIVQAVEAAEKMSGESAKNLYVSISSNNLISERISSELLVTGHEITDKDTNRLLFQVLNKYHEQEVEVLHTIPYDYVLDGNRGIENPLGMYGNQLAADFHVITSPTNHLINLSNCLARCQLEISGFICASYASGLACITEDEMTLGVTLIDFGGGSTSVSIFNKGHLVFTDGIPIGGIHVTNDIARGICTDFTHAERIKTLYGTTILTSADSQDVIEVATGAEGDEEEFTTIERALLVEIIRARVEEIIEIIVEKLHASGLKRLGSNKIIITGGGSQLSGMKEIVAHMLSKNVRAANPQHINGLADSTSGPAFATSIGMLLYIAQNEKNMSAMSQQTANDSSKISGIINWLKENFG
jgi:cell division protein FtsA